jgi:amino acid transporter
LFTPCGSFAACKESKYGANQQDWTPPGWSSSRRSFGASIFAASRILYALARDGFAPRTFARLHPKYRTPWNAELAVLAVSAILLVVVTVWQEREVASSGAWIAQAFVFFVLIPQLGRRG